MKTETMHPIAQDSNSQANSESVLIREIKKLIKHGENDTLTYSIIENSRKVLFNIEQDQLIRIPSIVIAQTGEQFEKDQEMFHKAVSDLDLTKIQLERVNGMVTVLYSHCAKFLDEFEAEFDRRKECDSPEIAGDYLIAAIYMRDNFKRHNHRIITVEEWIENYNPY